MSSNSIKNRPKPGCSACKNPLPRDSSEEMYFCSLPNIIRPTDPEDWLINRDERQGVGDVSINVMNAMRLKSKHIAEGKNKVNI